MSDEVVPPDASDPWSIIGASVIGDDHVAAGFGCDDSFGWVQLDQATIALVAADGAGSRTGTAAWGSWAACQYVIGPSCRPLIHEISHATPEQAPKLLAELFHHALEAVTAQAATLGFSVEDLATTLSVAVATPAMAHIAKIGDGIVAYRDRTGVHTTLVEQKMDYANLTTFLHQIGDRPRDWQVISIPDVEALALTTDGLRYKVTSVSDGSPFEPFFVAGWQRTLQHGFTSDSLANSLQSIDDDQTGDDKTLVMAVLDRTLLAAGPEEVTTFRVIDRGSSPQPPPVERPVWSRDEVSSPDESVPPDLDTERATDDDQTEPVMTDQPTVRNQP